MATQSLSGQSIAYDWATPHYPADEPMFVASSAIDATGEKLAMSGRVWLPNRGAASKDIQRVGFRFGTVVKAGGSGLTVSLQDPSMSAGQPMVPDETQDQTVAIANGNASFASNTWMRTDTLSATRAVNHGDLLSIVIEYDGSGRQGSDSVMISGFRIGGAATYTLLAAGEKVGTPAWGVVSWTPNLVLEMSDGTFGTLFGASAASALGNTSWNSGSTPNEYALAFQFPFPVALEGIGGYVSASGGTGANGDFVLYEGTTALATVSVSGYHFCGAQNSPKNIYVAFSAPVALSANTTYYLAIKPTTANNLRVPIVDVSDAGHWTVVGGHGTTWTLATRSGGAWTATATRRPFLWPVISGFSDGVGGGGRPAFGDRTGGKS